MPSVGRDLTDHSQSGTRPPVPSGLALAPFRGARFVAKRVGDVAAATAPPYDLIGDDDLGWLMESSPYNVTHITLAPGEGDQEWRHRQAASTLRQWLAEGLLRTDPEPSLYVYEGYGDGRIQRGLIGGVALAGAETGIVLPHEDVVPEVVDDRLAHIRATRANLEPILLTYEGGGSASQIVEEIVTTHLPLLDLLCGDGRRHRLWQIADPAQQARIATDLHTRQALIADGHHRYAAYRALQTEQHAVSRGPGPWDFGLALLVDAAAHPPHLGAMHRVIPDLDPGEAVTAVNAGGLMRATPVAGELPALLHVLHDAGRAGPAFAIAGAGQCHVLTIADPQLLDRHMSAQRSTRWRQLPTSVLHTLLIPQVWGISEDTHSVRVVHDDAAAAVRAADDEGGTAVLLPPLGAETVSALAAEGERVPRKSTSFGPKPRTGLVLRTFATAP